MQLTALGNGGGGVGLHEASFGFSFFTNVVDSR